jgi:predicted DNA-binding transcriptional regulator YafY
MTPTERWPALLLHLSPSAWMRAEDLAQALGVSERTIYRDVQSLKEAGIPVEGVPGQGYRLPDDYLLDPLALTVDEAVMLVLGSAYAAQNFDGRYRAAARSAHRKLEDALPERHREKALSLQGNVSLVPPSVFGATPEDPALQQLRRALLEERTVQVQQDGTGAPRSLNPYGLVRKNAVWYLVAYAPERDRVVHVRLDRDTDVALTNQTFHRPSGYRSDTAPVQASAPDRDVRVVFAAEVVPSLQIAPSIHVERSEELSDGRLILTLRVQHELEILPWLLSWGAHVRVLEPHALRQRLGEEARRIAVQYQDEPSLL